MKTNLDAICNVVDGVADVSVIIEKIRIVGNDINAYMDTEKEDELYTVYRQENKVKSDIQLDYLMQLTESVERLLKQAEDIYNQFLQNDAK